MGMMGCELNPYLALATTFATGRAQAANGDGFRFGTPQFLAFDLNQCFDKS
jgi:hypothetical protein